MTSMFWTLDHEATLQQIQDRLGQGATPARILAELLPRTKQSALSWGRSLAAWEEFRLGYSPQAIALARLNSVRGMRDFNLTLKPDGRVVERTAEGKKCKTPKPAAIFTLAIGGEEVRVEYTPGYFPNDDTALVYFVSPYDPAQPHPLSDTGYFSRFVPHDVVEACGGPQAYAALLAEARLRGEEQAFIEAFEGPLPETDPRHRDENRPQALPGGYAERVIAREEKPQATRQEMLC
jgi:hypothetical protein